MFCTEEGEDMSRYGERGYSYADAEGQEEEG
jgi:hypothetical protein